MGRRDRPANRPINVSYLKSGLEMFPLDQKQIPGRWDFVFRLAKQFYSIKWI